VNIEEQPGKKPRDTVGNQSGKKKPYRKPAYRYERVFETMALSCGKVQNSQSGCHSNRKLS
jgi:hypothetical protein